MIKASILKLIRFYKKYISNGYYCKMVPTCSEYTYQAIEKYGVIKGMMLGTKRILKCNPFRKGGIDLLE